MIELSEKFNGLPLMRLSLVKFGPRDFRIIREVVPDEREFHNKDGSITIKKTI